MKLNDYLKVSLAGTYHLSFAAVSLTAAVISLARRSDINVILKCSPKIETFESLTTDEIWGVLQDFPVEVFELSLAVTRCKNSEQLLDRIEQLIHHDNDDISLMALALSSEMAVVKVFENFMGEPMEGTSHAGQIQDLQPGLELVEPGTWMSNGIMTFGEKTYDLHQELDQSAPLQVHIARIMFATRNQQTGVIQPVMLEGVSDMLAALLVAEHEKTQQATANAGQKLPWPADPSHWIFDQQLLELSPEFPTPWTNPLRGVLEAAITKAARFAVCRATGSGTSRGVNLEGFVANVAIGLLGEGLPDGGEFNWASLAGNVNLLEQVAQDLASFSAVDPTLPAVNVAALTAERTRSRPATKKPVIKQEL